MRILVFAVAVAAALFHIAPAHADDYDDLVARLKGGDVKIGYTALRDAYAQSPHYQPEAADFDTDRHAMLASFDAKDCTKALAAADKILASTFIDIATHLVAGRCFELADNPAKAEFHRTIARGLIKSILASGDGKTKETAYVVVTVSEEYDVLTTLGLRLKRQSLVQDNGHSYDAMEARSDDGAASTLFFQIDRPMAWLSHELEK